VIAHDSGPAFNPRVPNAARIYDYLLGGKSNYAVDRAAAAKLQAALPGSARACRANRDFLQRAVRYLTAAGIRQYIDIGSGLPTVGNVHETAHQTDPAAKVAYVDYDPVVIAHARALLGKSPAVAVIEGDLRDPAAILTSPDLTAHIDFSQPAAVPPIAVLHFLTDDDRPHDAVRQLIAAMAPGSYLALTHGTADQLPPAEAATARQVYDTASAPLTGRTCEQVAKFFDGMELIDPGITDVAAWHPEIPPSLPRGHGPPPPAYFYAGIGVKH